jgi:hypothetical protein
MNKRSCRSGKRREDVSLIGIEIKSMSFHHTAVPFRMLEFYYQEVKIMRSIPSTKAKPVG